MRVAEDKKNPLGPTGDHVRANVERLREARGLTKKDLADEAARQGRPIPPLGISRIEAGKRRVDADDLLALALALNVSPLALLLPPEGHSEWRTVQLTAEVEALVTDAWLWAVGSRALPAEPGDEPDQERQEAFEQLSLSGRERYLKRRPASRAAEVLHRDVDRAVVISQYTQSEGPGEFRNRVAAARASLQRVAAELDRMELEREELERAHQEHRARSLQGTEGGEGGEGLD